MAIVRDDDYESMGTAFQLIQVELLNQALKEHGIEDPSQRQAICATYTFAFGDFLDQCWFTSEGRRVYPMVCFAEQFPGNAEDLNELDPIYASESFDYHEYAHGSVAYFFEDNGETIPELESGSFADVADEEEEGDED
jgi:hypothetical protein